MNGLQQLDMLIVKNGCINFHHSLLKSDNMKPLTDKTDLKEVFFFVPLVLTSFLTLTICGMKLGPPGTRFPHMRRGERT